MSLMEMITLRSSGPRTEPCGTTDATLYWTDL